MIYGPTRKDFRPPKSYYYDSYYDRKPDVWEQVARIGEALVVAASLATAIKRIRR